jgi:hypothetical protein
MNKIKEIIIVTQAILLIGIGGFLLFKHDKKVDNNITSTVLPKNDAAKVVINEIKHTISVTTASGTKTTYLPPKAAIEVGKNGIVTVVDRVWGWQLAPYAGIGYSNGLRIHTGIDFFYFHRFDVGVGLLSDGKNLNSTAADLNLSYNFYSNTSMALSYSSSKVIGCFLKFRF